MVRFFEGRETWDFIEYETRTPNSQELRLAVHSVLRKAVTRRWSPRRPRTCCRAARAGSAKHAPAAQSEPQLAEIVVSAQKRTQSLQDVPTTSAPSAAMR